MTSLLLVELVVALTDGPLNDRLTNISAEIKGAVVEDVEHLHVPTELEGITLVGVEMDLCQAVIMISSSLFYDLLEELYRILFTQAVHGPDQNTQKFHQNMPQFWPDDV